MSYKPFNLNSILSLEVRKWKQDWLLKVPKMNTWLKSSKEGTLIADREIHRKKGWHSFFCWKTEVLCLPSCSLHFMFNNKENDFLLFIHSLALTYPWFGLEGISIPVYIFTEQGHCWIFRGMFCLDRMHSGFVSVYRYWQISPWIS